MTVAVAAVAAAPWATFLLRGAGTPVWCPGPQRRHAEADDIVARNVAALAGTPTGRPGRPSKSLTLGQPVMFGEVAEVLDVQRRQRQLIGQAAGGRDRGS